MKILVCIKQVPDTTEITIDPHTNTLNRAGVPSIVNPFDSYALEMAVRLKEKNGGEITVISMGPEHAKAALKECLAVGADRAILVTDKAFGGSDTFATSYILSRAIKKIGSYDIIFCGKQAIDGDTGQVGPEIAEHLDLAQITYVKHMEVSGRTVRVQRELENGIEIIEADMPLVVTVIKNPQNPRLPSLKSKLAANKAEVQIINNSDLQIELSAVGLRGSPTHVKKIYTPIKKRAGVVIDGEDAQEAAALFIGWFNQKTLLR